MTWLGCANSCRASPMMPFWPSAVGDGRILITFDKDFGELAAQHDQLGSRSVVLIRVAIRPGPEGIALIVAAIDARTDWAGHFSVVEPGRIRRRPLGRE